MKVLVSTGLAREESPGKHLTLMWDATGPPPPVNAYCNSPNPVGSVTLPLLWGRTLMAGLSVMICILTLDVLGIVRETVRPAVTTKSFRISTVLSSQLLPKSLSTEAACEAHSLVPCEREDTCKL